MSPAQYKARYENLPVYLGNGSTVKVQVNQYRLNPTNVNAKARDAFMAMLAKTGIDRELTVQTMTGIVKLDPDPDLTAANDAYEKKLGKGARKVELTAVSVQEDLEFVDQKGAINFANIARYVIAGDPDPSPTFIDTKRFVDFRTMARYVFSGKGSPEACQIVLQLAGQWGLAPDGLQKYADQALGLDCNGFVGNYLWHEKRGNPWTDLGVGNHDLGPDAFIDELCKGKGLTKWDDIHPSQMYVLGMVDSSGQVMRGGPAANEGDSAPPPGHIVITEPGRLRPAMTVAGKAVPTAIRVVESTAAHTPGLWESWYSFAGVSHGIFTLNREDMARSKQLNFKIVQVM
jgi:hypothetical protein